jgi:hypothetical protein
MITSFPKVFAIGTDYIRDIFNEEVEVTEKIDGSQFDFGKIGGKVYMRSKGAMLFSENPEKMFSEGISYIESIQDKLPEGKVFFCEYLKKPKHNTLKYNRIPKNHIMLFSVMDINRQAFENSTDWNDVLEIEHVPVIHYGKVENATELIDLLKKESVLGGCNVEGVVVKNYHRQFLLGGQPMPLMAGKFVSESFKEVHRERWGAEEKGKSRMETFFESFRTPARWEKAVQHLQEKGELKNEPSDIGKLFKEVHIDIESEEKEAVKEFLWREFNGELKRRASGGMAEWYKNKLMERSFEGELEAGA